MRLAAVPGGAAHAGLLEMEMEAGGYGTVCGLNSQAANVACRQIGFEFGVVASGRMGAQASAAQAVPLLLQKPCSVKAQRWA